MSNPSPSGMGQQPLTDSYRNPSFSQEVRKRERFNFVRSLGIFYGKINPRCVYALDLLAGMENCPFDFTESNDCGGGIKMAQGMTGVMRVPIWVAVMVVVLYVLMLAAGCGNGNEGDSAAAGPTRGASVAIPTIEGPVSGGEGKPFIAATTFDLAQVGYSEAEYFISGTAAAYTNVGLLRTDGKWAAEAGHTAEYKTRILVYRPISSKKFNGTVLVEWFNVSGGLDAAPDWISGHTELIREGFAWVGVSAQRVGVEGGNSVLGMPVMPLKTMDPERYGSLAHPGDSFSYDIFSQAAQAIRRPAGPNPLGGLHPESVIAVGESQSAMRMVTYANAVHPLADIYDGFLIHSRGGSGAPLSERPQSTILVPMTAQVRSDINVPVLTFETETDLTFLYYFPARQPDSERFRLWEVAGTAHADTYTVEFGFEDLGDSPDVANILLTTVPISGYECGQPINSGPQHFVLKAAIAALNEWVRYGRPPPTAPRLEISAGPPVVILRDVNGNALGGIRTPQLEVPVATLSGEGQSESLVCLIFGTTVPFDGAKLASLYADHEAYVSAFNAATDRAVQEGFILPADAELMKAAAAASDIGS